MLRIYLDHNVYKLMQQKHPYFNEGLLGLIEKLKDRFVICYSDAHLEDLSGSNQPFLDEDLKFISNYSKDYFAINIDQKFSFYLANPLEAYHSKNFDAINNFLKDPQSISKIFDDLSDSADETNKPLIDILGSLLNLPILPIPSSDLTEGLDIDTINFAKKWILGHNVNSVKGIVENSMQMTSKFLFDESVVTELRKFVKKFFNRDSYSWNAWNLDFSSKLKETPIGKSFIETIDSMLLDSQKDNFYLKFLYGYSILELYNITEERNSNGKLKKFTYDSLSRDGKHAFFAAHADYLITDDKGMQTKAFILYKLFNLPTKVLSIKDFLSVGNVLFKKPEDLESFNDALIYDIKHALLIKDKVDIRTGVKFEVYKTTHNYFDYFNRAQIVRNTDNATITLFCERDRIANFVMFTEIERIVDCLLKLLGEDDLNAGSFQSTEIKNDDMIRTWTTDNKNILYIHLIQIKGCY